MNRNEREQGHFANAAKLDLFRTCFEVQGLLTPAAAGLLDALPPRPLESATPGLMPVVIRVGPAAPATVAASTPALTPAPLRPVLARAGLVDRQ